MSKIRPLDYVLAALMSVGGVFLMWENIAADQNDPSLIHQISTQSWLIVPAFLLVTVPILWRRRNIVAVVGITVVATAAHVLAFDWLTRCGVVLPLSFALAYAVARFARTRRDHLLGLAGIVVLLVVTLLRDSSADLAGALPIALPGAALFYGAGLLVQNRVSKRQDAVPAAERATV
jgi:drug/metabolite transporter superfamily protein YnfA